MRGGEREPRGAHVVASRYVGKQRYRITRRAVAESGERKRKDDVILLGRETVRPAEPVPRRTRIAGREGRFTFAPGDLCRPTLWRRRRPCVRSRR